MDGENLKWDCWMLGHVRDACILGFFFCVYFFESPVETVMDNFYFYFTCCIGEKGHTMDG